MSNTGPVLIVDSDPVLRAELIQTLARAGVTQVIAENSAIAAFQRLDDTRPRTVLVDWQLKGAGAIPAVYQLIEKARALGFALPVYLVAPFAGDGLIEAANALGASGVIAWPKDWASLTDRLHLTNP